MLALPYKKYWYKFDGDFVISSIPIILHRNGKGRFDSVDGDTGCAVWDSSVFLSLCFEKSKCTLKSVLELGSGLGLCGIAAYVSGVADTVVLTDLPYILESTKMSVISTLGSENSKIIVTELDWYSPQNSIWTHIDTVIASDVIWIDKLVEPLVETLNCTKLGTVIYMSNQRRSDIVLNKFLNLISQTHSVEIVEEDGNLFIHKMVHLKHSSN